ncbi:MAG: hypothetical protein HYV23_07525 [Deltaproteobacteria bacterium]|nr:hypothetical protein [Deltaproteobacteria bacterium]
MVRRSREEWRALFEEHGRSGMTEKAFCEMRELCPKHFNLRKKQLGWPQMNADLRNRPAVPAFVRVEKAPSMEAPRVHGAEPRVLLRLGRCEWELRGLSEDGLLRLMAALA